MDFLGFLQCTVSRVVEPYVLPLVVGLCAILWW